MNRLRAVFYFMLKSAFTEFSFQHKHNELSAGGITIAEDYIYLTSRKL